MRGKFIVIEGGDGAGKDTQVALLHKELGDEKFVYTRDPGGTALGMELRQIVQHGDGVAKETELLLFLASRAQLVHEVVSPALQGGKHVICNRFDFSTIAYQIYGRQRLELKEFLVAASNFARSGTIPDLIVLLDVLPEVGLARVMARHEKLTRFEKEKLEFHTRVREGYLASDKEFPNVKIIDAGRTIEEVYRDVINEVQAVLNE